jgi:iron complex transport system substrate-binding protein
MTYSREMTISRFAQNLIIAALTALLVLGCRGTVSPISQHTQLTSGCQSIEHDAGVTKICGQPHTIAVLSPYLLDMLLALGEQPAAYAGVSFGRHQFDHPVEQIPYLGSRISTQPMNLGDRDRPSLEALTLLKPDLILGEQWQGSQGKYELFSQIAPTMLLDDEQGGWQRNIQQIAKVLDRSDNLQQMMAVRKQRITAARQKFASLVSTHPRVLLLSSGDLASGFYPWQERSVYSNLLEALGFRVVQFDRALSQTIDGSPISLETLPQMETDILIVIRWNKNDAANNPLDWQQLQQEWNQIPLLKTLPVSQAGRVYFMDAYMTMMRGSLAEAQILNDLLQQIFPGDS